MTVVTGFAKNSGNALSTEEPHPTGHPEDLVRCHRDVTALYDDLGRQAARLIEPADDAAEIMPRWQAFSDSWMKRWHETATWCRFSELAGSHMGEVYDRMAQVHGELPTMRLHYQSLLVRFHDSQAAGLSQMKRDLQRSHAQLMRLDNGAGGEAP